MVLPIVKIGDPVLNQVCKTIDLKDPELHTLIQNMFDTLRECKTGVGLAAPQVGNSLKLFIIEFPISETEKFSEVFINPKIIAYSKETCIQNEGCLSVPNMDGDVERPIAIKLEYYDINLNKQSKAAAGILARIIQHEYDHLNGVLYTSYLKESTPNQ